MASELIGRMACPECGFPHAHVKIKTDKDGSNPYRHCPDCGAQYFTRNTQQANNLRAKMRPEGSAAPAPITPREAERGRTQDGTVAVPGEETTPLVVPPAPQRYKMVLGVKVPIND